MDEVMIMFLRGSALLLFGFALSACASIVEGTDQSIAVNLSPENTTCEVIREGARLSTISKENRFINLSKSKNDLIIECEAPGHLDEVITLESSASGWGIVGCILIDLCITDYSTGALNKYPETLNISLIPKFFDSAESRDRWYAKRQGEIEGRWDEAIESKAATCRQAANKNDCLSQVSDLEDEKAQELESLELRRLDSEIVATSTQPDSFEGRLKELKDLLDRGVITQDEYAAKRSQILSEL